MKALALRTSAGAVRRALAVVEDGRVVPLAEWDPAEHPREPSGTDKGGEFAPADAAAFEAVHAAFQPAKERIAASYEKRVTDLFENMKKDLGP